MSQTERILFLDRHMRLNGQVTVAQAAETFEVCTRQIKRDIEYLRTRFSAPIDYDYNIKAYRYNEPFRDLEFADQKITMFYIVMKSLTETGHYIPIYSDDVISMIKADVPADYRRICDKISWQIPQSDFIKQEIFMEVCDSMRNRKCLELTYLNVKKEQTDRLVEPEQLINYSGNWYLVCWDNLRNGLRTFHMSRIKSAQLTKTPFSKHTAGYPTKQFKNYKEELAAFLSDSFGIFKGRKKAVAKIRFTGSAANIVGTQQWHPDQKMTQTEDATELSFPVAHFTETLARILSFGQYAQPLEPPELVKLWKDEIQAMAKNI